jgi:hypothetical protein
MIYQGPFVLLGLTFRLMQKPCTLQSIGRTP